MLMIEVKTFMKLSTEMLASTCTEEIGFIFPGINDDSIKIPGS